MLTDTEIKDEDGEIELKVFIDSDSLSGMDEDLKKKKSIITPKCNQCEYTAKNAKELKRHINVAHKGIVFRCDQCDYSSSHKSNLYNHQKAKHEMRVYKCLSCETTSSSKQYIQKHMKEKHDGQIAYFCSDCDYHSKDKQQYECHKRTVHSLGRFKQHHPVDSYLNNQKISEQIPSINPKKTGKVSETVRKNKPSSTYKPFKCDVCEYSSTRQYNVAQQV